MMPELNLEGQEELASVEKGILESEYSVWKWRMDGGVKDHAIFRDVWLSKIA